MPGFDSLTHFHLENLNFENHSFCKFSAGLCVLFIRMNLEMGLNLFKTVQVDLFDLVAPQGSTDENQMNADPTHRKTDKLLY